MNSSPNLVLPDEILIRFLNVAVAAFLVCGIALMGSRRVRNSLPMRHALLVAGLTGSLVGPVFIPLLHLPTLWALAPQERSEPVPEEPESQSVTIARRDAMRQAEMLRPMQITGDIEREPLTAQRLPSIVEPHPAGAPSSDDAVSHAPIPPQMSWTQSNMARLTGTLLCAIWTLGAAIALIRASVCLAKLRRWLRTVAVADSPHLASAIQCAADRVGLHRSVTVCQSGVLPAPVTMGLLRPCIVVPNGIESTLMPDQLRAVLQHEMAHIARFDLWIGLLQQAAHIVHWWNPLVRLTNRRIADVREQICDDIALCGLAEPTSYAATLINLAERCSGCVSVPATLGIGSSPAGQLEKRICHIVSPSDIRHIHLTRRSVIGVAAAVAVMMGTLVCAQIKVTSPPAKNHDDTPTPPTAFNVVTKQAVPPDIPATKPLNSDEPVSDANTKPVAEIRKSLLGSWKVESCASDVPSLKAQSSLPRWRWTIKKDEITWGFERQEWKMTAKIDPSQSPKHIDVTFLDGPHKGETSLGIYDWTGEGEKKLHIMMQDPEAKVGRPTNFERQAGSEFSRFVLSTTPPIDAAKELASFQGTWSWDWSQLWTWPQPIGVHEDSEGRKSEKRWVIDGNQITWVGRDGRRVYVSFTIDPFKTPKQIDFTFLSGPQAGKKSIGIYESRDDENYRILCMTDPGTDAPRPTDYSASSLAKQTFMGIHRVAPPARRTSANEIKRLQGVWQMTLCDSTHRTFGGTQKEVSDWQWTIKDDEILWSRQGEVWKLKLDIDPSKSPGEMNKLTYNIGPFEMDLTFLSGPFMGSKCKGIYGFGGVDGQSLMIAIQDPGSDAPRPTRFYMKGSVKTGLWILRPSKPSDAERESAAFEGTWTLRNFDSGKFERNKDPSSWPLPGGQGPDKSGDGSELRWVVKQNEIAWTSPSGQEIKASFTIDPNQIPKQIDLKFLSGPHQGETCPGIYQRDDLDENILWLCMADPGSRKVRPKEFSYKWGEGRSLLSLYAFDPAAKASR